MINDSIKKRKISVTLTPQIKKRVEEWEIEGYSSASDLINTALIEFFARRDHLKELENDQAET